jgi:hypothetical protein
MRVELDPDVFTDSDALTDLLVLLRCLTSGQHDWGSDPEVATAAMRYFAVHAPALRAAAELGRKGAVAMAWRGPADQGAVVRVCRADLADSAADLCRAAELAVEDRESDKHFVEAVARAFGAARITRAIEERWVEFPHGGGSRLVVVATDAITRFRRVPRVGALLDSDRLVPGQRTLAYDKRDQLRQAGVAVHVLELREAENYVPNRVLAAARSRAATSRRLDHLKQLNPQQRGHLDMKKGFGPAHQPPVVPIAQRGLYGGVDAAVLRALRGGFGSGLLQRMNECHDLREQDFAHLGDDVTDELRRMLATLSSVI